MPILESSGFVVEGRANPGIPMVLFLNREKAVWQDPAVRKAVQIGINRQQLMDTLFPEGRHAMRDVLGNEYAVDIGSERGRALLDEHAETRPAADDDFKRLNAVMAEKWSRFWYRLDFDAGELP